MKQEPFQTEHNTSFDYSDFWDRSWKAEDEDSLSNWLESADEDHRLHTDSCFYAALGHQTLREEGVLSEMRRKRKPRAKKIASEATAMLMVPPASLTAAITAEPRKLAPFAKMS